MTTKEIRVECLAEIFNELKIIATIEQIEKVANDFYEHIEIEKEQGYYQHVNKNIDCEFCSKLKKEINNYKKEKNILIDCIKKIKNTDNVWVDGLSVMYEKK